jgi:predicted porin
MKKNLIHLAVAALAFPAGYASAQSNVQIYGSVDLGFAHRGDAVASGVGDQNAVDSGIAAGNRLGFKGAEDLGNGYKVIFDLEAGFNTDTGQGAAQLFNRQAWLGVSGNFGTLTAGRQYSHHFVYAATLDPFAAGTVAEYRNLFQNIAGTSGGGGVIDGLFDPTRIDNALTYVSPKFSGFSVAATYSPNAQGQEGSLPETSGGAVSVDNKGDLEYVALFPRYVNGPLDLGVAYYRFKSDGYLASATLQEPTITNWLAGGAYDFGAVKLAAFYDKSKVRTDTALYDGMRLKSWMIGATAPFGKHALQVSYIRSKLSRDAGSGVGRQAALGYTYHLSKRTNLYAAYANIHNSRERKNLGGAGLVCDANNCGPGKAYQNGAQFGVLHKF